MPTNTERRNGCKKLSETKMCAYLDILHFLNAQDRNRSIFNTQVKVQLSNTFN